MQYEEGGSLEQVLQNRKLPADEVKMLLVQIICSYIRLR